MNSNLKGNFSNHDRRSFLKKSLVGGVSLLCSPFLADISFAAVESDKRRKAGYDLSLDIPTKLYNGQQYWAHPRAGIIPGFGQNNLPRIIMTINSAELTGSDVFKGMFGMKTDDLGKSWSPPRELKNMAYRYEVIEGIKRPVAVSDFWPRWHAASKTLLGIGHTVAYTPEWKVPGPMRPRDTTFSIYNSDNDEWTVWQKLKMPEEGLFHDCGAGSVQRYDEKDGTILLPVYYRPLGKKSSVTVVRCNFDGRTLTYHSHGNELAIKDETRGLHEPSLTRFKNEYFMTIRNDKQGFVTRSRDGMQFDPIQPWKFDDDTDLGNYNTQTHWVTHSEGLFLVYTRRGANNDDVPRNRAPLFMAQVDTERLHIIRNTERILVPNRGVGLGNFGVTDVNQDETWVTTAEGKKPKGAEKYGSNGSVFIARIHWNKSNRLFG